jgi:hypothetical protein
MRSIAACLATLIIVGALVVAAWATRSSGTASRRGVTPSEEERGAIDEDATPPVMCPEDEVGPIASLGPCGEWWGKGRGVMVRAHLERGQGNVAVRWNGRLASFSMLAYYPPGYIDPARIRYHVWNDTCLSEWHASIPALARRNSEEEMDRIVIDHITGSVGASWDTFTLYRIDKYDPRASCTESELKVLAELAGMIRSD